MVEELTSPESRMHFCINDIYRLLSTQLGIDASKIEPTTDISRDLGCDGDDFSELMARFKTEFSVDGTDFRWYFHHSPEAGFGPAIKIPDGQGPRYIPITPEVLLNSARTGRWTVEYPAHSVASDRHIIVCIVTGFSVAAMCVWFAFSFK